MRRITLIALTVAATMAGTVAAQQPGHQTTQPAAAAQGPSPAVVAACAEAHRTIGALADRAGARLESARQTNSPPELRAALADLQALLVEIRARAAACAPLEAAAPPDPHAGHAMSPASAPAAAAAEAIDPVCGMKADPKTAPKAEYQGRTYYFCSESDRELFVKEPGKYVKQAEVR